jgi:hypothetical protein
LVARSTQGQVRAKEPRLLDNKKSDDVMPRGSMPGERRGGRTRTTPNRRSILADRMMVVLSGCAMASPKECLSKLVNDAELPADIRITIAQKAFPDRTGGVRPARRANSEIRTKGSTQRRGPSRSALRAREPRALEALSAASPPLQTMSQAARDVLLNIVSDASASAKARWKAATKLAAYLLPKKPVDKRWRFTEDACGFAISGAIAREYRALDFELRDLKRNPNRDFPEITQRIRELQARIDKIHLRLQCPCPALYNNEQISEDLIRLAEAARKREAGIALRPEEDAEEAHRKARLDCYVRGPEQAARHYRQDLEGADLRFRKGRFFKDEMVAPPLSRRQRNDFWLLRWLFPPLDSQSRRDPGAQADANMAIRHPFRDEEPAVDGNFYPQDSKLRPASADEPEFEEFADVPKYCIYKPGRPPIFTNELPTDLPNDKSALTSILVPIPRSF